MILNKWGLFIGAGLSSGIEFLGIVAIAYALSSTGYRREALCGSVTGIVAVVLAGALLGPALVLFPLRWLQVAAGLVLIYFGWKWSNNSVIRLAVCKRAGWIVNHLKNRALEMERTKSLISYLNVTLPQ